MATLQFQIRKSASIAQPYYWRLVATSNNAVLASSETYVRKTDAKAAIDLVFSEAKNATYVDLA